MNLHEYYRNHKDAINASIMDIACDLAVGRLLNAHGAPFETFVEADDPEFPDCRRVICCAELSRRGTVAEIL